MRKINEIAKNEDLATWVLFSLTKILEIFQFLKEHLMKSYIKDASAYSYSP